jgi:hypothetical protein
MQLYASFAQGLSQEDLHRVFSWLHYLDCYGKLQVRRWEKYVCFWTVPCFTAFTCSGHILRSQETSRKNHVSPNPVNVMSAKSSPFKAYIYG